MYEHADQSWRAQPPLMSDEIRLKVAERIGEYAKEVDVRRLVVVFHGGEPLLAGASRIAETASLIRSALPPEASADFSLQTNGTLLNEEAVACLEAGDVSISLSLDGPREINDLHRLGHDGGSSFEKSLNALELLESHPKFYAGLIAVIDPKTDPEELLTFFASRNPPRLDFLLPDANHQRPPVGRDSDPALYKNWLMRAFDLWFDTYSHVPVRLFDAVLSARAGLPSDTDAFGFGDVSLLSIETDGSYHDLDVLKITAEGMTALGCDVASHSISEAISSVQIATHRNLLKKDGLSSKCLSCPEVEICGGGSVPHRYSRDGFCNPTVYCEEMLALIGHARKRVQAALLKESSKTKRVVTNNVQSSIDLKEWERPERSKAILQGLLQNWANEVRPDFDRVFDYVAMQNQTLEPTVQHIRNAPNEMLAQLIIQPGSIVWANVMSQSMRGVVVRSIDGEPITPDSGYVQFLENRLRRAPEDYPRIHERDLWLELPFGKRIEFEDEAGARKGAALIAQAFEIIEGWRPALVEEIRLLNPDIQFIRDLDAHPDKAVSFSDNSTPGALYLCIRVGGGFIDPYLLADSLIHEHRHQKLYLLQREVPLVVEDKPLVPSPWRSDLRPPSGLFHAVFVFVHLSEYWEYLALHGRTAEVRLRAVGERVLIDQRIEAALPTLRATKLTKDGYELLDLLKTLFRGRSVSAATGGD
ncbi:MAG: uncharacterized protein QOH70_4046 [Blastocatellia bacterium]|jgi:uncharacterized protein|nr:uncharacterized protein [Blastocatellia bacterium]